MRENRRGESNLSQPREATQRGSTKRATFTAWAIVSHGAYARPREKIGAQAWETGTGVGFYRTRREAKDHAWAGDCVVKVRAAVMPSDE